MVDGKKVVLVNAAAAVDTLNVEVADPVGTEEQAPLITEDAPYIEDAGPMAPGYGGGFGGGGGGGFGGGAGGGGLGIGGLAAIGGLTAAAIIAADDNNKTSPVGP
jgi:hypothetical protein